MNRPFRDIVFVECMECQTQGFWFGNRNTRFECPGCSCGAESNRIHVQNAPSEKCEASEPQPHSTSSKVRYEGSPNGGPFHSYVPHIQNTGLRRLRTVYEETESGSYERGSESSDTTTSFEYTAEVTFG